MEGGQFRKARNLVWENRWRYLRYGGHLDQVKLRWLQARIDAGLDKLLARRRRVGTWIKTKQVDDDLLPVGCAQGERSTVRDTHGSAMEPYPGQAVDQGSPAFILMLVDQILRGGLVLGSAVSKTVERLEAGQGQEESRQGHLPHIAPRLSLEDAWKKARPSGYTQASGDTLYIKGGDLDESETYSRGTASFAGRASARIVQPFMKRGRRQFRNAFPIQGRPIGACLSDHRQEIHHAQHHCGNPPQRPLDHRHHR